MARSILPLQIREALERHKWVFKARSTTVETYERGSVEIYIQPSKADRNFFAWDVVYYNKPAKHRSGVIELLLETIKNG